ncbi:Phosphoglucosamine mutase [Wohlfahrtiimonas chitiniclastica SH04]|uniref:Phosphoglucosamine mutase n=1 Tax=Wohlfahrtiimonas chitiniclastica SH04 TaxID=1261130 RepID=L8XZ21_9GAMM|nr:phosphoglucosamine mutase [Wohlfahrtiimonas chitiniclastica]ELV08069.1 Phosphoglucosamine mutase [Wohlfahrtiimonas chitiniclastica SH04]OYQ88906.1 phosphoglucosamine mutase [Wohlfahrtiimonas chitiniclastica]
MRRYFGTDGVRGRTGELPMTPDFILRLGYAAGKVLAREGARVLIGKDTRISGYMFESALEAGLTYAGVGVALTGPMPTPAIAYLTRTLDTSAGCMVSASHNPYFDNGVKFFGEDGQKLDDALELEIERHLDEPLVPVNPDGFGRVRRITDAAGRYIEFCKSSARDLNLRGMKIVLDCANGATYHIAPYVFTELGAKVIVIGNEPNGFNINDQVGSTQPAALQKKVLEEKADCGIGFDGDGDRLVIVDGKGVVYDGDAILYLIATHRREKQIVATIMSNLGFEHALKNEGIELIRAKVGDRYVLEQLKQHNLTLGGESSGHIICMDKHTTGDGIIAALQALQAILDKNMTIAESLQHIPKSTQTMINVQLKDRTGWDTDVVKAEIEQVEKALGDNGRVLIRPSGTEPVVRVMVESFDVAASKKYAESLANLIKNQK